MGAPESPGLILAALAVHLVLAGAALLAIRRIEGYTRLQATSQALLALLVPLFGAIVVYFMARDEMAGPSKPDDSRFDRQHIGND